MPMSEEVASYVEKFLEIIPEKERTKQPVYEKRLQICMECPKREDAMCLACGCYLELRAAVAEKKCPYRKWEGRE